MTSLQLRDLRDRSRAVRVVLLLVAVVLAAATLAHHRGAQEQHDPMGAMGGEQHAVAMTTCLGILGGAIAVVGLVLIDRIRRRFAPRTRRLRRCALRPPLTVVPAVWIPPPRDGPGLHLQLCVDRR